MKKDEKEKVETWKKGDGREAKEENPAGSVNLDDDELEGVAGGLALATERNDTSGCCGSTEGTGTCAGPTPTSGCCGTAIE